MNKIIFDKNKLKSASSDCFNLVQNVIEDIDYVYEQILNLSNNNIWVGADADVYINIRKKDRNEYEKFFEQFKDLLKDMNNIVEEIDNYSGNITIDRSMVNNIDCQLDKTKKIMNDELKNLKTELNKCYLFSSSLVHKFRNYNINNLINCNNKIKEVIDSQNEINNWINTSTKYVNLIFDEVNNDINKTKINSLKIINSIITKI